MVGVITALIGVVAIAAIIAVINRFTPIFVWLVGGTEPTFMALFIVALMGTAAGEIVGWLLDWGMAWPTGPQFFHIYVVPVLILGIIGAYIIPYVIEQAQT